MENNTNNQNGNAAPRALSADEIAKKFAEAEKAEAGQNVLDREILKFEAGESRRLYFTGQFHEIQFAQGPPKKCPIFINKEAKEVINADVVLCNGFARQSEGFYEITCTGEKKSGSGKYQDFSVKPLKF